MSAVTGRIVASKSISISRAARKIAQFIESGTGAKPDTAAYLRRAVVAFNELIDFHDELERGVENGGDEEVEERKEESTVGEVEDGDSASEMKKKKKKKKKRKREKVDDERSDIESSRDKIDGLYELEKEYNLDTGNSTAVSSEGDSGRKKKKRKKSEKERYIDEN